MKNLGLCQKACTGQSVYGRALNRETLPLITSNTKLVPRLSLLCLPWSLGDAAGHETTQNLGGKKKLFRPGFDICPAVTYL